MRKPNPKIAAFVAIATTTGVILLVWALMNKTVPQSSENLLLVIGGGLLASYGQIVNFYFQKDVEPDDDSSPPSTQP